MSAVVNQLRGDAPIRLVLGPSVPLAVLRFVWDLEDRGVKLRIGDDARALSGG